MTNIYIHPLFVSDNWKETYICDTKLKNRGQVITDNEKADLIK